VLTPTPHPPRQPPRRHTHPRSQQLWNKKPAPKKYTREGSYHIFIFPARRVRALKIKQINSTILKVPDGASGC
jgi:hypothetical protein